MDSNNYMTKLNIFKEIMATEYVREIRQDSMI